MSLCRACSYKSYQIALYDSRGEKLIEQNQLEATLAGDTVHILWELPTKNLQNDDYQVTLSGVTAARQVENMDRYYFRLTVQ